MPSPAHSRPATTRRPLGDGTQSANILSKTPQRSPIPKVASLLSATGLPHHESLMANGALTVRDITSSPEDKRVSAVTNESNHDSKRDSQVSNASTTASSSKGRRKTHIGPWQLGRDIGQGYSCKVRKVRHTVTGQQAAVKIIDKKIAEQGRSESLANLAEVMKRSDSGILAATGNLMPFGIEREVVILKLLEHPNVVKLFDVWENRNQLYLIMEYVDGGELFDYVADQDCLPEDETVWLFRQMAAALLHCHRLGIHHRDLKPENILIETTNDSLRVKLADFGMAALQPRGKQLTTACGSVHYAAPEVFERRYDGSKVDVWSLGVILYVMLTGTTPFTYDQQTMANDVSLWYSVIKSGRYPMPEGLSEEAKDLIGKMLKPDPCYRISLEGVWNHPFIHKYKDEWDEDDEVLKLENWIGPQPVIETWNIRTRKDIDREILRNLRTLWHSEKEESLINKILSAEANQEKYFYFALQRHREEQLENYVGTPESVAYSASDYHHLKSKQNETLRAAPAVRTQSQYSILNNEHLQSRASLLEPPSSVKSYDPFRASRDPIIAGKESNYTSVIVHRGLSQQSKRSGRSNSCQPTSLRVESLRRSQRRLSTASSTISLKHSSPRHSTLSTRTRAATIRSLSRSSIGNSPLHSSPPIVVNPSFKHKRAVNFSHRRRLSAVRTSIKSDNDLLSVTPCKSSNQLESPLGPFSPGSPTLGDLKVSKFRGDNKGVDGNPNRANKKSSAIDSEARKVSTELEKFCEEAFNRSSAGSSQRTFATVSQGYSETPPSSVSHPASLMSNKNPVPIPKTVSETPSQHVTASFASPNETPNTFIARELAETRKKLAAKYANDQNSHPDHYLEVLAHLDSLLKPSVQRGGRTTSLPEPRIFDLSPQLPVISEDKTLDTDASSPTSKDSPIHNNKLLYAKRGAARQLWTQDQKKSIRLVDDSSPPRPAPLVIRKASKDSMSACSSKTPPSRVNIRANGISAASQVTPARKITPISPESLDTICEEHRTGDQTEPNPIRSDSFTMGKKKGWWRRKHSTEARYNNSSEAPQDQPQHLWSSSRNEVTSPLSDWPASPNAIAGALEKHKEGSTERKPHLLNFFGKKWSSKGSKAKTLANDIAEELRTKATITSAASPSSSDFTTNRILEPRERSDFRDLGVQQNWLARFLHIKPAVKVLCFQVPRGRARAELTRLLKAWRPHGIKDVVLDRERNLLFGRLDSVNALGYKAVEFVAEIFVVLEKGRRKGLSIARFTQRKGAASSFRRIVEEVESRLTAKGTLVMAKEVRKEMELLLAESDER